MKGFWVFVFSACAAGFMYAGFATGELIGFGFLTAACVVGAIATALGRL